MTTPLEIHCVSSTHMRAIEMLRQNISALLVGRRETQTSLAQWLKHDKSWINKFLSGSRDELQLRDLDKIAEFFGIATYQLFQPGISRFTERRRTTDRRSGYERRISHAQHQLQALGVEIDQAHPRRRKDTTSDGPRIHPHKL